MEYPVVNGFLVVPERTEVDCYACQKKFWTGSVIGGKNFTFCPRCGQQHSLAKKKTVLYFEGEELEFKETSK